MIIQRRNCKECDIIYLATESIKWRSQGYCTRQCQIHEPRGIPSEESIGFTSGIAAPSQRKRHPPALPIKNPRKLVFDMAHYPKPKGWQVENWRLAEKGDKVGYYDAMDKGGNINPAMHYKPIPNIVLWCDTLMKKLVKAGKKQ